MTTEKSGGGVPPRAVARAAKSSSSGVDSVLQGALGTKLRDAYQEVVNEAVPDKFLTLLQELKKKETGSGEAQS